MGESVGSIGNTVENMNIWKRVEDKVNNGGKGGGNIGK